MFTPFRLMIAVILLSLACSPHAHAGGFDRPQIDVEKIDDACKEKSSVAGDSTAAMVETARNYRECLKAEVLAHWENIGDDNTQAEFKKNIDEFEKLYMSLIGTIYYRNKGCPCGTIYSPLDSYFTADTYLLLLRAMKDSML